MAQLSENGWTRKELLARIKTANERITEYVRMVESEKAALKAIAYELGTLNVGRKKLSDAQHRRYQDPAERDRSKNRANQQWDKLDKEERTKLALRIWETRRANALKKSA